MTSHINDMQHQEGSYLIYVICVCFRIVVSNTYCVVFLFCLSSSWVLLYVPVSLGCLFLIASAVFSKIYLNYTMNETKQKNMSRRKSWKSRCNFILMVILHFPFWYFIIVFKLHNKRNKTTAQNMPRRTSAYNTRQRQYKACNVTVKNISIEKIKQAH